VLGGEVLDQRRAVAGVGRDLPRQPAQRGPVRLLASSGLISSRASRAIASSSVSAETTALPMSSHHMIIVEAIGSMPILRMAAATATC
jgi:hypothetical protein